MKIDAYNVISPVHTATKAAKVATTQKVSATDKLEISQAGKDYQIAKKAVKEAPDVRQDLVDSIKSRIAEGTYNVSDEDVAEKMVSAMFG